MQEKLGKLKKADKIKCLGCLGNFKGACVVADCIRKADPPEPIAVPA